MVEPVDLAFLDLGEDLRIERLRRGEIGSERLFDRDAAKDAVAFIGQPMSGELLDDRPEKDGGTAR